MGLKTFISRIMQETVVEQSPEVDEFYTRLKTMQDYLEQDHAEMKSMIQENGRKIDLIVLDIKKHNE